jgi:hypothetical protein
LKTQESTLVITSEDFLGVFKRQKRKLLRLAAWGAIAGLLFALGKPLVYRAQGSFKEGATHSSAISLSQLFATSILEKENGAHFLMRSEVVLRKVVEKMGLQVHVKGYESPGLIRNFFENSLYSVSGVVLEPKKFAFSDVKFDNRKEKKLLLVLKENQECYFFDEDKQFLAKGKVGQPIEGVDFCLTLASLPSNFRTESPYRITLSPWHQEVTALKKNFEVRCDKKDHQILWLYFQHRDPEFAARMVNQISESFLNYLLEEEEKLSSSQVAHLDERRKKLEIEFDEALSVHMDTFKKSIDETGFVEVKQQLELMQKPLLTLHDKMVELGTLESSLKEVQATYAKTIGLPLYNSEMLVASTDESIFWPEQFAGIDLTTAKELHGNYQRQLDQIEGHIDRIEYLLPKIQEEGFELHSIGLLAQDDVAASLVSEASKLALSLNQVGNYSQKDQQRLNESLKSQRHFIESHLKQTAELYGKQAKILQNKLASLRSVMLNLIEKEKNGVQEQMHRFQTQLAQIPEKWRLEKILEAKSTMMKKVVEGVSQVIEGKIAEHHLKTIGSKMIDAARIPELPFRKNPLWNSLLFSSLFFLTGYAVFFVRSLWRGIPLSFSSATAYGLPCAGVLSSYRGCAFEELPKYDLEISRKVACFIEKNEKIRQATCIALTGHHQREWSENLARLLALQNKKILLVDVSFPARTPKEQSAGILPFLQKKIEKWSVVSKVEYDWLPSGGTTRYATEIFQGERFDRFLDEARSQYDQILLISEAPLDASETMLLIKKCDLCAAFVSEESYDSLKCSGLTELTNIIYLWTENYV